MLSKIFIMNEQIFKETMTEVNEASSTTFSEQENTMGQTHMRWWEQEHLAICSPTQDMELLRSPFLSENCWKGKLLNMMLRDEKREEWNECEQSVPDSFKMTFFRFSQRVFDYICSDISHK